MSYPQFSYTFPGIPSTLASSQLLTTAAAASATAPTSTSTSSTRCCEGGRPIATDPTTGQSICSCQYNTATLLGYSRMAAGLGAADGVYTSAYAAQGYMPFGTDPSAFYSSINGAYDLKNNSEAWKTLAHTSPYYHYDPTTMSAYPYPNGYGGLDSARRKNATRESTNTLKAWLYEHRKNPYPTKGEKIMLAIITKMTLTQVSTWFANARRRLKKENKMTWSPRNRTGDEDVDAQSDGENEDNKSNDGRTKTDDSKLDVGDMKKDEFDKILDGDSDGDDQGESKRECETLSVGVNENIDCKSEDSVPAVSISSPGDIRSLFRPVPNHLTTADTTSLSETNPVKPRPIHGHSLSSRELGEVKPQQEQSQQKPKIWSVADVVTSDSSDRKSPRSDTDAVISHQYPSAMNDMRKWVNGNYSRTSTATFPYSYPLPNFVSTGVYPLPGMTSSTSQSSVTDPSRVPTSSHPGYPPTGAIQGLYGGTNKMSGVGNSSSAK